MDEPQIPTRLPEEPQAGTDGPFFQRISPLVFTIISLMIIFFLYQFVGGIVTLLLFKGSVTPGNVVLVRWATMIGQILFILIPTLYLVKLRRVSFRECFRLKVPDYKEIVLTIVAVFALQQILQGYMVLQDAIPLPAGLDKLVEQIKELYEQTYRVLLTSESVGEFLFVVLVVAIVPALSEELLFRGLVQSSLAEQISGFQAAVIAGVVFGAYHLNPVAFVPLAALGVFFGFIVYRSGSIIVAVSAHLFNNLIACVAMYLQIGEEFIAVAPGAEVTTGLLLVNNLLFAVVFVAATYYFVVVTRRTPTVDQ